MNNYINILSLLLTCLGVSPLLNATTIRKYYLAAEEVQWNYAPGGNLLADIFCTTEDGPWLRRGVKETPPVFKKAIYQEYEDADFKIKRDRTAAWAHLGILGPVIRAEVGDKIEVAFLNRTKFPVTIHPHGVKYDKANEGSGYQDQDPNKSDDLVPPGGRYTYHWDVPERSGPGEGDPSSIAWLYHSHVESPSDTAAGLIGVIIISRRGTARADGSPSDVDREVVNLYTIFDENQSRYAKDNLDLLARNSELNDFHSINGLIFGNLPDIEMHVGERTRWYLLGFGNEVDIHTPHWHGNTVLIERHRVDVAELLPASTKVADMVPDSKGTWLYHCHVDEHMQFGMAARYIVK